MMIMVAMVMWEEMFVVKVERVSIGVSGIIGSADAPETR